MSSFVLSSHVVHVSLTYCTKGSRMCLEVSDERSVHMSVCCLWLPFALSTNSFVLWFHIAQASWSAKFEVLNHYRRLGSTLKLDVCLLPHIATDWNDFFVTLWIVVFCQPQMLSKSLTQKDPRALAIIGNVILCTLFPSIGATTSSMRSDVRSCKVMVPGAHSATHPLPTSFPTVWEIFSFRAAAKSTVFMEPFLSARHPWRSDEDLHSVHLHGNAHVTLDINNLPVFPVPVFEVPSHYQLIDWRGDVFCHIYLEQDSEHQVPNGYVRVVCLTKSCLNMGEVDGGRVQLSLLIHMHSPSPHHDFFPP